LKCDMTCTLQAPTKLGLDVYLVTKLVISRFGSFIVLEFMIYRYQEKLGLVRVWVGCSAHEFMIHLDIFLGISFIYNSVSSIFEYPKYFRSVLMGSYSYEVYDLLFGSSLVLLVRLFCPLNQIHRGRDKLKGQVFFHWSRV